MDAIPDRVTVTAGGRMLSLGMADGPLDVAAPRLRAGCNCADCRRARFDGRHIEPPANLRIVKVEPIGQYAIAIGFSDGHERGIFPWRHLIDLCTADGAREGP